MSVQIPYYYGCNPYASFSYQYPYPNTNLYYPYQYSYPVQERPLQESSSRTSNTLFVKNIPFEMTTDELRKVFEEFGGLATIKAHTRERGIAFITYYDMRAAENALNYLNGKNVKGRNLVIEFSYFKNKKSNICYNNFVVIEPLDNLSSLNIHSLKEYLSSFYGEICTAYEFERNKYFVEFYDLRNAQDLAKLGNHLLVLNVNCKVYFPSSIPPPPVSPQQQQQQPAFPNSPNLQQAVQPPNPIYQYPPSYPQQMRYNVPGPSFYQSSQQTSDSSSLPKPSYNPLNPGLTPSYNQEGAQQSNVEQPKQPILPSVIQNNNSGSSSPLLTHTEIKDDSLEDSLRRISSFFKQQDNLK